MKQSQQSSNKRGRGNARRSSDSHSAILSNILSYIHERWKWTTVPPHPGQLKALQKINESYNSITINCISSGNSFGKTHLMCNMILNMCYPKELRTFDCELFHDYDRLKSQGKEINIWIVGTAENIRQGGAIYSTFLDLDRDIVFKPLQRKLIINGQHIILKTHDQDVSAFAGPRLFAIFVDEPMKENIFHECILRLTGVGNANKMFQFFTPVTLRASYLMDYMDSDDTLWIKGSIYDNPYATPKQIEAIERIVSMNPDEKSPRLYGEFAKLSGRIFKTFSEDEHVIPELPDDEYSWFVSIDPHDIKPAFATLFAVNRRGIKFAVDNYPKDPWNQIKSTSLSIKQQVNDILLMVRRHTTKPFKTYGDKIYFANSRNNATGITTLADEYRKCGLPVITDTVSTDIYDGHLYIHEHLYFDEETLPKLLILPEASNIITALARYSWKQKTLNVNQSTGSMIEEEWECPIATLRFFLTSKPAFFVETKKSGYEGTLVGASDNATTTKEVRQKPAQQLRRKTSGYRGTLA